MTGISVKQRGSWSWEKVLPGDIEEYGVSGNMPIFFLFAFHDKKKKGKKLDRRSIGGKGNLSDCQSLVNGRPPHPQGVVMLGTAQVLSGKY
jgi:hypothetical protein